MLGSFRIIARTDGERVRLYSRPGNDLTKRFPLIVEGMARLPSCAIDGEAVACDDSGAPIIRPASASLSEMNDVFLYAFDLIELAGADLRREPLEQRKADLRRLLADAGPGLVYSEWIDGGDFDGATVFERACTLGVEGRLDRLDITDAAIARQVIANAQAGDDEGQLCDRALAILSATPPPK